MLFRLPQAKRVTENPSPETVKELTGKMPTARPTKFGNLNVQTQVLARSKGSTFLVTDEPDGQNQAVSTDDAAKWADRQDEYIAGQEMVVIDGYIGNDPEFRTPTRLYVEAANANIAGMQQQLYFGPPDDDFEPELTVIYTPNLKAEGFPDDRLIMVDLEQGVTRVFNSDYFGESKKGGLRMWNKLVYDRGGLPLHAGCKVIPTDQGDKVCLAVGLSGTGKTTTTFTRQNGSLPVQDDFVAWMPDGRSTRPRTAASRRRSGSTRRTSRRSTTRSRGRTHTWRTFRRKATQVDFYDKSYTQNGRATFPFGVIESAADRADRDAALPPDPEPQREHHPGSRQARRDAGSRLLHARRNERHRGGRRGRGRQVAACARDEPVLPDAARPAGQPLPGAARASTRSRCILMNTGRVGGPEEDERSKKVRIKHSSAIVKGIAEGTIEWERDPDFGYLVATAVPGIDDEEVLQPRKLYERTGRADEYRAHVERLKADRAEFLGEFNSLSAEIVAAVG